MKKFFLALLAGALILTAAACKKPADNGAEVVEPTTVGTTLAKTFKDNVATAESNEALANLLIADLPFMAGVMPVEEGFLSGFDNFEVMGFSEAYMFGPMMGSIAFVGYVFELPADADVEAFKTSLTDNANLRWNICVEAEEMVVENVDNKVFFVMCPTTFEQPEMPEDEIVDDEILVDEDTVVVGGEVEEEAAEEVEEAEVAEETEEAAEEEVEVLAPVAEETEENLDNEISADAFLVD